MSFVSSIKRAQKQIFGKKILQATNNASRAVAPFVKPIFVAAGAIVGGAGGATAGAEIGGIVGHAMTGKSFKEPNPPTQEETGGIDPTGTGDAFTTPMTVFAAPEGLDRARDDALAAEGKQDAPPTPTPPGPMDQAARGWKSLPLWAKIAVGAGLVVVVGGTVYVIAR